MWPRTMSFQGFPGSRWKKRRGNFSFHPSSFVPRLEQTRWEAVNWNVFPLWIPAFTTFRPTVQNHISFFFLFSCFLFFFHTILFRDKTRRATRMLQTQAVWSSNVPPPFLLCYWLAVGQLKAVIGSAGCPSSLAGMRTGLNGWTQMLWMCPGKRFQGC